MIQPALSSPSTLPSIGDLLARGKQAAMMSQRDLARELLAYVVYLEPGNADGWLWLSGVVDSPEQVRYCLQRTLRIDPYNTRALRGIEWLDTRQKDIDDARAAAERVKPYWQTSKPKPLLNLIKKRNESAGNATATGETHPTRNVPSWTSVSPTSTSSTPIPYTRSARSNMPTMPVSAATLEKITGASSSIAPVKDPTYRDEVLAADDDLAPRFVTNLAIHNLWRAVQKVTGDIGFNAMLQQAGMSELSTYMPEPDETPAINYTRFGAFTEAMEEFYGSAVAAMEAKVGREMFRNELAVKGKLANSKSISFKLMSAEKKLQTILMELADAHARMGMEAYFEERDNGYMFVVENCPYCYNRLTNAHCNVTAGYLQAGVEWATGRTIAAEEVTCRGLDEHDCSYWIPNA